MTSLRNPIALLARLLLAWVFVAEGLAKIAAYDGTADYMQAYGVPPSLLPLVIATELGGGILVATGLLTRYAAFALAGFCLLTALFFHSDFGNPDQLIQFQKNFAMAGGFLMLVGFGAGAWSLDAALAARRGRRAISVEAAREPRIV